jgi:hypothetical protein
MSIKSMKTSLTIAASVLAISAACAPSAKAASLPDTVKIPAGGNYGSTSFYDGFGRVTPGWTILEYATYADIDNITTATGDKNPAFKDPHIGALSVLTQISYTTNWHPFGGDGVGFSAAVPLVDLSTSFADNSKVKLSNNGFGIGDMVWGPIYQSKFYKDAHGRPDFAWRFQLIILSPIGGFDKHKNVNQGCGYWAINPYVSFTWAPTPKLEFSTRFNYQYNLSTTNIASPPPVPHLVYENGQAGQMIYDNFDASYKVLPKFELGFNGFFIDQLTPDKTNGQIVGKSRQSQVYVGPGARYTFDPTDSLNMNVYLPVEAANASVGPKFNLQFIHRF